MAELMAEKRRGSLPVAVIVRLVLVPLAAAVGWYLGRAIWFGLVLGIGA